MSFSLQGVFKILLKRRKPCPSREGNFYCQRPVPALAPSSHPSTSVLSSSLNNSASRYLNRQNGQLRISACSTTAARSSCVDKAEFGLDLKKVFDNFESISSKKAIKIKIEDLVEKWAESYKFILNLKDSDYIIDYLTYVDYPV